MIYVLETEGGGLHSLVESDDGDFLAKLCDYFERFHTYAGDPPREMGEYPTIDDYHATVRCWLERVEFWMRSWAKAERLDYDVISEDNSYSHVLMTLAVAFLVRMHGARHIHPIVVDGCVSDRFDGWMNNYWMK